MRIVERTKDIAIKLWKDESGASLLEYSLLLGLITAGIAGTIGFVGDEVEKIWENVLTEFKSANK